MKLITEAEEAHITNGKLIISVGNHPEKYPLDKIVETRDGRYIDYRPTQVNAQGEIGYIPEGEQVVMSENTINGILIDRDLCWEKIEDGDYVLYLM